MPTNQWLSGDGSVEGREKEDGGLKRKFSGNLGMIDMFRILMVMMISQEYTCHILSLYTMNVCNLLFVSYTSINV